MAAAMESVAEPVSLEEPLYTDGGDAMYVIDQVKDTYGEESWISALSFRQTVEALSPREKKIMELRYLRGKTQMEVAREIGISESVAEPVSLEEPLYTDGGDAMYVIDQVKDTDGEESWISALSFRQTVEALSPREKKIMELRYLRGKTQMEVAREIGISQAQVSRLEKGALRQFRPDAEQ